MTLESRIFVAVVVSIHGNHRVTESAGLSSDASKAWVNVVVPCAV